MICSLLIGVGELEEMLEQTLRIAYLDWDLSTCRHYEHGTRDQFMDG